MGIVFDEVVGTVEPRQEAAQGPSQEGGEAAADGSSGGLDEAAMEKWMKRRAWISARRRAD